MAGAAVFPATGETRSQSCRADEVKRFIAHQPGVRGAVGEFVGCLVELADQRVPIECKHPFALAASDLDLEALHRHDQVEALHPFDRHGERIVVAQVGNLGLVFPLNGGETLFLTPLVRLLARRQRSAGGQSRQTFRGFLPQPVVIGVESAFVALETPAHSPDERLNPALDTWRQHALEALGQHRAGSITATDVHPRACLYASATLAAADYGAPVPAVVNSANRWGCQFHPERSAALGARILKNFLELPA